MTGLELFEKLSGSPRKDGNIKCFIKLALEEISRKGIGAEMIL